MQNSNPLAAVILARRERSAALLDAGSVIPAVTLNGNLTAFTPGQTACLKKARIKVAGTEMWAQPVVAGRRIFISDAGTAILWAFE